VLVGAGVEDQLLPVANQRHLASIIKGARLREYENASHGFFIQEQATFVPELQAFLGA
jgi:pimeloyl-ACP methyl ester carboxylesterase